MYITKDKNGETFKWSKKGKNRECWVKDKKCITRECFSPENCGSINEKTQEKTILGICQAYYNGACPMGYHDSDKCPITINKDDIEKVKGPITINKDDIGKGKIIVEETKSKMNDNKVQINSYQTKSYYKKLKRRKT